LLDQSSSRDADITHVPRYAELRPRFLADLQSLGPLPCLGGSASNPSSSGQCIRALAHRWSASPSSHCGPKPPIWKEPVYKALNQKYAACVLEKPAIILYICSPLCMEI